MSEKIKALRNWRMSHIVRICKGKGNSKEWTNYVGITTMGIVEKD